MKKLCILIILWSALPAWIFAQNGVNFIDESRNDIQKLDIYLVIGQSNMAGRAEIRDEDNDALEGVYLFTGHDSSAWTAAKNPLNLYSTVRKKVEMQRLGPAYAFAKSMKAARPQREIGLVVNALGGTKIVQWLPGTRLYSAAISRAREALKYGQLRGIIWHQGESDCDPIRVPLYLGRIEILINAIREEFENPNLPFIAGQVFENEKRHAFNEMLLQLPGFIKNTAVVSSADTNVFDGTHFDSESANLLGSRYADEMLKLMK